jgi:hypothetical protein
LDTGRRDRKRRGITYKRASDLVYWVSWLAWWWGGVFGAGGGMCSGDTYFAYSLLHDFFLYLGMGEEDRILISVFNGRVFH